MTVHARYAPSGNCTECMAPWPCDQAADQMTIDAARSNAIANDQDPSVYEPTTITTPEGTWLERDLRIRLAQDVDDIRAELAALQDRFEGVMRDVREIPGGEMVWQRIDAYPGLRLDRDMGAGLDADGWIGKVAAFLEDGPR